MFRKFQIAVSLLAVFAATLLATPRPPQLPQQEPSRSKRDENVPAFRPPGKSRSMLAFSSLDTNNERRKRGWYAVWCYAPRVRKTTVYHWQGTTSVAEWIADLSRLSAGDRSDADREWAVLNGGYFDYNAAATEKRRALIGSVGNGRPGRWSHGSPPASWHGRPHYRRWAFGMQEHFGGADGFRIALMQPRSERKGFHVPPGLEEAYPYGLSALLCLLKDGVPMVWQERRTIHVEPPGQWTSSTEFHRGYYRRAAIAWTADGKHLFLVVHHHPHSVLETRNLFALYAGRQYRGPGPVLGKLRTAFRKLSPAERPCRENELPRRIHNAMLLDGGHSATLMYRRAVSVGGRLARFEDHGSWINGPPWRPDLPQVPTMIQIVSE